MNNSKCFPALVAGIILFHKNTSNLYISNSHSCRVKLDSCKSEKIKVQLHFFKISEIKLKLQTQAAFYFLNIYLLILSKYMNLQGDFLTWFLKMLM